MTTVTRADFVPEDKRSFITTTPTTLAAWAIATFAPPCSTLAKPRLDMRRDDHDHHHDERIARSTTTTVATRIRT